MTDAEIGVMVTRAYRKHLFHTPGPEAIKHHLNELRETPRTAVAFFSQVSGSREAAMRKGRIDSDIRKSLYGFRYLLCVCIVVFVVDALFFMKSGYHIALPYGGLFWFALIFCGFLVNGFLVQRGLHADSPLLAFPMSVAAFKPVLLNVWVMVFLLLLSAGAVLASRAPAFVVIAIACALAVSSNLASEGWPDALTEPVVTFGGYFLSPLESPQEFLREFNSVQSDLECHPRTHPPFGVLLTDLFYRVGGGRVVVMSVALAALSLFAIPLLWLLFYVGGSGRQETRNLIVLSFAACPAFAIYSVYSLDAIILTCSIAMLIGVRMIQRDSPKVGYLLMTMGLVATSLLTFGSVIFLGILGVVFLVELWKRNGKNCTAIALSVLTCLAAFGILIPATGYNHFSAFLMASQLENPDGFRLFAEPLAYFMTRSENVLELALFASLPIAGAVTFPRLLGVSHRELIRSKDYILYVALAMLLLLFAAGAYRTGETARACLFMYPFFWLTLARLRPATNRLFLIMAGIQTILMQVAMDFTW